MIPLFFAVSAAPMWEFWTRKMEFSPQHWNFWEKVLRCEFLLFGSLFQIPCLPCFGKTWQSVSSRALQILTFPWVFLEMFPPSPGILEHPCISISTRLMLANPLGLLIPPWLAGDEQDQWVFVLS